MKEIVLLICLLEPLFPFTHKQYFKTPMINLCFTSSFIDYQRLCKNYSSCLTRGEAEPVTWISAGAALTFYFLLFYFCVCVLWV